MSDLHCTFDTQKSRARAVLPPMRPASVDVTARSVRTCLPRPAPRSEYCKPIASRLACCLVGEHEPWASLGLVSHAHAFVWLYSHTLLWLHLSVIFVIRLLSLRPAPDLTGGNHFRGTFFVWTLNSLNYLVCDRRVTVLFCFQEESRESQGRRCVFPTALLGCSPAPCALEHTHIPQHGSTSAFHGFTPDTRPTQSPVQWAVRIALPKQHSRTQTMLSGAKQTSRPG